MVYVIDLRILVPSQTNQQFVEIVEKFEALENQYTENLIILVPLRFQFPQQFLQNLRGNASVQVINFQDPILKNDFNIDHQIAISNFPQKLAKNQYVFVATQNISSLSDISSCLLFEESLRTTALQDLPNFQDPIEKSDFEIYYIKGQSLNLPEKVAENHDISCRSQNMSSLTDIFVLY